MVFTPAKPIASSQNGPHKNLEKTVCKHLETQYQKPIPDHTKNAFDQAHHHWQKLGQPEVILDSACGTAESSRHFEKTNPDKLIIGLDQSDVRLSNSENKDLSDNLILLRCDCTDFWRLAEQANWLFDQHYLLYPNPYPKMEHLKRRWHGHPALPSLLAISKKIELRTNWKIYAEEFHIACMLGKAQSEFIEYRPENYITAFERKYSLSSHHLWQVISTINHS